MGVDVVCLTMVAWTGWGLALAGRLDGPWGPELAVVLRARDSGEERRIATSAEADGFSADVDLRREALGGEVWDVRLSTAAGERALGRLAGPMDTMRYRIGAVPVTVYLAPQQDGEIELSIDVGGGPHSFRLVSMADSVVWLGSDSAGGPAIAVTGRLGMQPMRSPVSGTLLLTDPRGERVYELFAGLLLEDHVIRYTSTIPLISAAVDRPLPRGEWHVSVRLSFSGMQRTAAVQAPAAGLAHHWWRRGRPMIVTTSAAPAPLAVSVRPAML